MTASGSQRVPKSDKLDEAQALAKSCAGRPDFLPCDGLSICATHSHGKCFKLHWCCHLGWCHCKYVYQPMTNVGQLPSTPVPAAPSDYTNTINLSVSLTERFLKTAPCFQPPPCPESPKYCLISELFIDDYQVKRINGKMCYVQRPSPQVPAPLPAQAPSQPPVQGARPSSNYQQTMEKASGPKMDHCSSPSSSEDSGINALGLHYLESCDEDTEDEEEEEDDELSTDEDSSPGSIWDQDECTLLSPSKSTVEIIEKIETTV
uniref:Chromosome 3 open reading frame 70 n=1 Tax=Lepisosteus oculatus TaxID=7918 RepID=W5MTL2_LEPOC